MNPEENRTTAVVPATGGNLPAQIEKKEGYWGRIAFRYTVVWRILLIALLLFAVLFMLLFSRAFTYDSLFCFFKDLQAVSAFVPSDYNTVHATFEQGEHVALSYRGGVAFVNCGGIEVYSPDGHRLLDVSRELNTPRAVSSRKYLVAFDGGGTAFSVTNSYAELHRGETDFPIYGAAISDSGHFALITASDQALSQVLLYDNNFNLIQRFQRASATVDVSLSDNGKRIALLGASANEGAVYSVLDIYRLGETEPETSLAFNGEMPLALGFTDNKNMMILTDKTLRCGEIGGEIRAALSLEGSVVGFTVNSEGALIALETDKVAAVNRVISLDKRGHVTYDNRFNGDISALELSEDEILLLSGSEITRIDLDAEHSTVHPIEAGATGIFAVERGQLRVVYPAKAEYLIFEEN